jgi:hypothetical protein
MILFFAYLIKKCTMNTVYVQSIELLSTIHIPIPLWWGKP